MIKDKYNTFLKTLQYSYQGCDVELAQSYLDLRPQENVPQYRALINPDKTKQDYDDKILSIDYNTNFNPGDVFRWINTDTHWIIYTRQLGEDAYFRGEIRRCRYKIKFKDENNEVCFAWAAIRGPIETQIESIQKNQVRLDLPNLGLNILMPRNEKTMRAFDRYSEFLFAGKCWRVQAPDSISMENVLEINAEEYYIDRDTDDKIEELKNGLVIEPIDPTPETVVTGNTFIKPKIAETYIAPEAGGTWSAEGDQGQKVPVCIKLDEDAKTAEVTWQKILSGNFYLIWTSASGVVDKKYIAVESLF